MEQKSIEKQLPINLIMNIVSFSFKVLIGLWIVPYLVQNIGLIAYGLVPLSLFFAEYVSIIIESFNSALNRYLLINLQNKNYQQANIIFNTSLILALLFILVQSLIMIAIIANLKQIINVPPEFLNDAIWLFALTFIGFSFSLVRAIFVTPLFSSNRLDLIKTTEIITVLLNAILTIILFSIFEPNLINVGISYFISSFIALVFAIYFKNKIVPDLNVNLKKFDFNQVKELSSMGGWVLVTQVGSLLFLKFDLFIANKFLGNIEASNYALILQWNSLIRAMASIVSGIMIPIIMIYYAKNEFDRLVKMLKIGIKIISIVIAIPIGIICAFSENILNIWIGNEFIHLNTLLILSLVPLIISVSITPLFSVNISYNKVKFPGIVSLMFGTISILLSIYLIIYTDLKLYSVVIASGIMLIIKNGIVIPIYTAHIMKIKSTSFIFYPTIGLMYFIIIFSIGDLLNNYVIYSSLISLFLMMSTTGLISLLFLFLYSLKDQDIKFIINKIISRKKRKNNEEK